MFAVKKNYEESCHLFKNVHMSNLYEADNVNKFLRYGYKARNIKNI